jgi:hypothetical protein
LIPKGSEPAFGSGSKTDVSGRISTKADITFFGQSVGNVGATSCSHHTSRLLRCLGDKSTVGSFLKLRFAHHRPPAR